jgi:hypothetical protein
MPEWSGGPRFDWWALLLYAVAAVCGAVGASAPAAHYYLHSKHPSVFFFIAYLIAGLAFGIVTLAGAIIFISPPATMDQLIFITAAGGTAGSLTLASANWSLGIILRRLGLEVQWTIRKSGEERRIARDDD